MTGETYQASGVHLDGMEQLKARIKAFASMTHGSEVIGSGGSFAGLFELSGYDRPVLVASADGVGTKLKIAAQLSHYESIGQDLVTLNVNDILTKGAKPLFFLDYVAFSDLDEQRMETLLRGIVWGCREVSCALIGGETAQLPGLYAAADFDLAGFVVGVAERDALLDSGSIAPGDCLVGIPSSGLHTNGFALARRVFNTDADPAALFRRYGDLTHTLGEELLARHRCYYPQLQPALGVIKGLAHITGGGLPGKMPAILPDHLAARFQTGSWPVPPIFPLIQAEGKVATDEMYRVFNMGLGMVAVCQESDFDHIQAAAPDAVVVGRIIERAGEEQVLFHR